MAKNTSGEGIRVKDHSGWGNHADCGQSITLERFVPGPRGVAEPHSRAIRGGERLTYFNPGRGLAGSFDFKHYFSFALWLNCEVRCSQGMMHVADC